MRELINKIQTNLGIQSARSKNISKHVFWSFLYKSGSIIANFILVPLTIKFLDNENYGVWLTLSSFIAWFTFFDIGLGHGLRNKFAEARANNDLESAKGYVSTAYFTIGAICVIFVFLSLLISFNVDWTKIFNTSNALYGQLELLMPIVFACFGLRLIFTLITSIYTADQHHSMQGKISFIIAVGSLVLIWLLTKTSKSSLFMFGAIFSLFPVLILFILNLYAFSTKFKQFKPKWRNVKREYFKSIFGLGLSFFVIQISVIVMFSTDNFIITQLFSPAEVVPYNIAYKYMGISSMVFTMVLVPYWSSITVAYVKEEFDWIKNAMKNLIKFAIIAVILIVIMVLIAPYIYKIWIGDLVEVPVVLTVCMATYFAITVLYAPFNYFINGIGKIKLHMYSFAIGALINIPLSIFLVKYTTLGVEGVIIATIICILPNLIIFPMQYLKLINNTATGIWDK
ncbi:lipopolysaccharide biosynthesis protein [Aequorivita nionensis]|uniref:lipopolysaccharide biosynthesis protein n=1 Tax=Aequorivita nionensis TaxID=1287690 RepID=UPI003965D263